MRVLAGSPDVPHQACDFPLDDDSRCVFVRFVYELMMSPGRDECLLGRLWSDGYDDESIVCFDEEI